MKCLFLHTLYVVVGIACARLCLVQGRPARPRARTTARRGVAQLIT